MALFELIDGRKLEYFENEIKSDKAILFLHGTPGDATAWTSWLGEVRECKAISTSRLPFLVYQRFVH